MARKLSRLRDFGVTGLPSSLLTWSQRVCEQVEAANADLQSQITAIAAAQAAADAAQTTANTAVTSAATAQTTANTVKRDDKITSSSVVPSNVLTASDAGANATIVVAAHTRLYGDATTLGVGGHTFTALAYDTDYGVYYDDITCADTAPTYHTTTNLTRALNSYTAGRHFVGTVHTPIAGAAPATGGSTPPGSGADSDTLRDRYSSL